VRAITIRRRTRATDPVATAVEAVRAGRPVVIVDAENPEDDGDLMIAAAHATPQRVAFMMRHTSGILCVPMPAAELDRLHIPPMVAGSEGPGYAVSVNARTGVGSGVSATDRARTIALLADPTTAPGDLNRPGHVFPLRAVDGGVLRRAGHTEAAVDLTQMAGLSPVAVIGEVIGDDGSVLRGQRLRAFARTHDVPVCEIGDLIAHRHRTEKLVEFRAASRLPTEHGTFTAHGFCSVLDGREHIALVMGELAGPIPPLVRVHSECLTGNVFDSARCDCSTQLQRAMAMVAAEGRGVVLYLRSQDSRGGGTLRRLHACHLNRSDTTGYTEGGPAIDPRDYGVGAQILADLGVREMRLLTNNPVKRIGLQAYGLTVAESVPLTVTATADNLAYLRAKRDRMGHDLRHLPGDESGEASSCG